MSEKKTRRSRLERDAIRAIMIHKGIKYTTALREYQASHPTKENK